MALAQESELVGAVGRRHRSLHLEDDVGRLRRCRGIGHDGRSGGAVGLVGIGGGRAGASLHHDLLDAQFLQLLDGFGSRGNAGLVRPAFFENGDFHGIWGCFGAGRVGCGAPCTASCSLPSRFFAACNKAIYRQPSPVILQPWLSVPSSSPDSISPKQRSRRSRRTTRSPATWTSPTRR